VNSTDRFKPLVARKKTASQESEQRDDVEHQRMAHEGDVFLDTEEFHDRFSLILAVDRMAVEALSGFQTLPIAILVSLLLASVDQVDHGARNDNGAEHRGQDAQAMHHGEAAHRAGAEDEQRQTGDQRGDVGVENGAKARS
jgi:hypothetical protein